jgi:hypothetical protein
MPHDGRSELRDCHREWKGPWQFPITRIGLVIMSSPQRRHSRWLRRGTALPIYRMSGSCREEDPGHSLRVREARFAPRFRDGR